MAYLRLPMLHLPGVAHWLKLPAINPSNGLRMRTSPAPYPKPIDPRHDDATS
ncbi:hypothetical protein FIBSPDRAFT_850532 [Athelia psychrophila]|uniref:Uncharacterized protein n=1 Tax=Athelia psychrophila TaxID=1759441 RepID=A0A166T6N4_9AGAM|nr:hypothetical protein FIBSPDRAFT_850532 [Fibularhizoctonia sp. CBS 109695]